MAGIQSSINCPPINTRNIKTVNTMDAGARTVAVCLAVAIVSGLYWQSWTTLWSTFLIVVGINFLMKMINKRWEEKIMRRVENTEKLFWDHFCGPICHGCLACMKGLKAIIGGREYPPVIHV